MTAFDRFMAQWREQNYRLLEQEHNSTKENEEHEQDHD